MAREDEDDKKRGEALVQSEAARRATVGYGDRAEGHCCGTM